VYEQRTSRAKKKQILAGRVFTSLSITRIGMPQGRQIFRDQRLWTKLIKRAMARNFSWDASAQRYEALYAELVGAPDKAAA
jgi:glycogen synthase